MFSLGDVLMKMGMPKAFGVGADFSGMDGERDLHISRVFHKAWGEVNEEGTEAAAATGTWLVASSAEQPPPPVLFRADHPFLFFIRHPQSGTLLFAGRFAKPVRE
jgi:serpin B